MGWSDHKDMKLITENFRKFVQKEGYVDLSKPEETEYDPATFPKGIEHVPHPEDEPAPAVATTDWSRWARPWGGIENPTPGDEYAHSAIFMGSGEGVSEEEHLERVAQELKKAGWELRPAKDNPAVTSWQKRTGPEE